MEATCGEMFAFSFSYHHSSLPNPIPRQLAHPTSAGRRGRIQSGKPSTSPMSD